VYSQKKAPAHVRKWKDASLLGHGCLHHPEQLATTTISKSTTWALEGACSIQKKAITYGGAAD
jgi:hypothetical protein